LPGAAVESPGEDNVSGHERVENPGPKDQVFQE